MSRVAFASLGLLLILVPQSSAHQTVTGTSSTGDVDTWGLPTSRLPECDLQPIGDIQVTVPDPRELELSDASLGLADVGGGCLVQACPMDLYWFTVTLTLLDPSPGDAVSLSADRLSLVGPSGIDLSASSHELDPTNPTVPVPNLHRGADIATYDDPVAQVVVQLGGCDRQETAIVTGLVVDGEVDYELTY